MSPLLISLSRGLINEAALTPIIDGMLSYHASQIFGTFSTGDRGQIISAKL